MVFFTFLPELVAIYVLSRAHLSFGFTHYIRITNEVFKHIWFEMGALSAALKRGIKRTIYWLFCFLTRGFVSVQLTLQPSHFTEDISNIVSPVAEFPDHMSVCAHFCQLSWSCLILSETVTGYRHALYDSQLSGVHSDGQVMSNVISIHHINGYGPYCGVIGPLAK